MKFSLSLFVLFLASCLSQTPKDTYLGHWKMNVEHAVQQDKQQLKTPEIVNEEIKKDIIKNTKLISESTIISFDNETITIEVMGKSNQFKYTIVESSDNKTVIEYNDKKPTKIILKIVNNQLVIKEENRPRISKFDRMKEKS